MSRFADALDRDVSEIKRPPPLPAGSYIFSVPKMPDPAEPIEGKPYERLNILVRVVQPLDDVDPEALAAFGSVAGTVSNLSYLFSTDEAEATRFEQTLNRLKMFLGHCGIDTERGSLKQALAQLPGTQFIGTVSHRLDNRDNETVYAEITRTTSA